MVPSLGLLFIRQEYIIDSVQSVPAIATQRAQLEKLKGFFGFLFCRIEPEKGWHWELVNFSRNV